MQLTFAAVVGCGLAIVTVVAVSWKWQLDVTRATVAAVFLAVIAATGASAISSLMDLGLVPAALLAWTGTLAAALAIVAFRFYRDPERVPPSRDDVVVSPADGTVVYVAEVTGGDLPVVTKHGRPYRLAELTKTSLHVQEAAVVGIGLNFLDVHVSRAPIAGRIVLQRRFPGRFGSLRDPAMIFENERATIVIRRSDLEIAVVLIASRLVRRIVTFVEAGEHVTLGERIGMIKFGSQVDVVIPAMRAQQVTVRPGQRVVAGETVLASLSPTPLARPDGSKPVPT